MKVTVKKLPNSEFELTIEVSEKTLEQSKKEVMKGLAQKKIDGFRAGHVPENVLIKHYGENMIKAEAMERAINDTFLKAIQKEKIQALEMPRIEIKKHDPLVYVATVAVLPEVEVPALKEIPVPKAKTIKVEKKEIEESKKMLQNRMAELKKQERKAKKGDLVEIDFEGFDEKGVSLEGTKSKHHPVEIGTNAFIPGFEEEIIGLKADDEKEFDITFPKDYHKKSFQNKKVKFKIKVHDVFEKIVPDFDEKLIEKLTGQKKKVADMEKEIEESLKEKYTQDDKKRRENEFLETLGKKVKIEVPKVLIDKELDGIMNNLRQNAQKARVTWEQYLASLKKTEEEMRKELSTKAKENVCIRLAFQKLIEQNKPKINEKDVEMKIKQVLMTIPADQKKEAEKYFSKGGNGWQEIAGELAVDRFFEDLFKN